MKRRNFLSMLGGAAALPVLPALPVRAASAGAGVAGASSGYARLLYGMAVYHAETSGALSAADLMPKLGVNAAKAQALMGEMAAKGVLTPATGAARASLRSGVRARPGPSRPSRLSRWLTDDAPINTDLDPKTRPLAAQETDNGKIRETHRDRSTDAAGEHRHGYDHPQAIPEDD